MFFEIPVMAKTEFNLSKIKAKSCTGSEGSKVYAKYALQIQKRVHNQNEKARGDQF